MPKVDVFISEVPEYWIDERVVYIQVDGWLMAMPLAKFRRGHAKSGRVLAEYDARSAEVVPMRRKKGEHG